MKPSSTLIMDVGYRGRRACAAGVAAATPLADEASATYLHHIDHVEAYESGAFYKREFPCLLAMVDAYDLKPDLIIIDGYVDLPGGGKGLGRHLYDALGGAASVIGVAKTALRDSDPVHEVYRGQSQRPLFVTSTGLEADAARELVRNMAGKNRIPSLLKRVDRLSRSSWP